ncbi:MAG: hypothetical protein P8X53_13490 [Chromatiales bacterium]
MRMKLRRGMVATLLAGAMIFAGAAHASHHAGKMGHGSAADRAARQTEHMTQALGLSEEQARQVGEINQKYATEAQASLENAASRDERYGVMREVMGKRDEELRQVLTDEQFESLKNMRESMRKAHKPRGGQDELRKD